MYVPPKKQIMFLSVSLSVANFDEMFIGWSVAQGPVDYILLANRFPDPGILKNFFVMFRRGGDWGVAQGTID